MITVITVSRTIIASFVRKPDILFCGRISVDTGADALNTGAVALDSYRKLQARMPGYMVGDCHREECT